MLNLDAEAINVDSFETSSAPPAEGDQLQLTPTIPLIVIGVTVTIEVWG